MDQQLEKLIELYKRHVMTAAELEAQRRSFAYGNMSIENPRITRQLIDEVAEKLL